MIFDPQNVMLAVTAQIVQIAVPLTALIQSHVIMSLVPVKVAVSLDMRQKPVIKVGSIIYFI